MTEQALVEKTSNIVSINNPMSLIECAVKNGATVETLERLMGLQERYESNQARKAFITAMQKFQGLKPVLAKSTKVKFQTKKGTTEYNFCSLPDIEVALKPVLSECELSYRFENLNKDGVFGMRCVVTHVLGHSESSEMYAPLDSSGNKNQIQGIGSTSTYLMRYTLIASFALTTADPDDDGQTVSDMPYFALIQHNQAVRDNLAAILAIKQEIANNDLYEVAMYFDHIGKEAIYALWVAQTKGGIFTTEEIKVLKSNEYAHARADYFAKKEES